MAEPKHIGFKTVGLLLFLALAFIWTLASFFSNWLTATDIWTVLPNYLGGLIGLLIMLVIWFIAHLFYRAWYKAEEIAFVGE